MKLKNIKEFLVKRTLVSFSTLCVGLTIAIFCDIIRLNLIHDSSKFGFYVVLGIACFGMLLVMIYAHISNWLPDIVEM